MRYRSRNLSNVDLARSLRKTMSYSERVLWASLRMKQTGFRFRRQVPVGKYILDFYCAEALVCVEVDGEQHAERAEEDAIRDAFLASLGILTVRIPSLDLFDGFTYTGAYQSLILLLEDRTGRPKRLPKQS